MKEHTFVFVIPQIYLQREQTWTTGYNVYFVHQKKYTLGGDNQEACEGLNEYPHVFSC